MAGSCREVEGQTVERGCGEQTPSEGRPWPTSIFSSNNCHPQSTVFPGKSADTADHKPLFPFRLPSPKRRRENVCPLTTAKCPCHHTDGLSSTEQGGAVAKVFLKLSTFSSFFTNENPGAGWNEALEAAWPHWTCIGVFFSLTWIVSRRREDTRPTEVHP